MYINVPQGVYTKTGYSQIFEKDFMRGGKMFAYSKDNHNTVLVTGYAKAPKGTAMQEIYSFIGVIMEIDTTTNIVVDAEFTLITNLAKKFLREILVGYSLEEGIDPVIDQIKLRYIAPSSNAMVLAIKTAVQRYWEAQKSPGKN